MFTDAFLSVPDLEVPPSTKSKHTKSASSMSTIASSSSESSFVITPLSTNPTHPPSVSAAGFQGPATQFPEPAAVLTSHPRTTRPAFLRSITAPANPSAASTAASTPSGSPSSMFGFAAYFANKYPQQVAPGLQAHPHMQLQMCQQKIESIRSGTSG